jgi:protein-S-isoprenylcysteine O-methyltransferase Ste14
MEEEKNIQNNQDKGKVHFILSHSYTVFLFAVVLGVVFDNIFPWRIFSGAGFQYIGLAMIFFGSVFIYWAQSTSSYSKNKTGFNHGPYKYLRSPTHFGLFMMTFGLALIINSPFSVLFIVIAHLVTKFIFLKKEEDLLEKKYGEEYSSYKRKTKNLI